MNEYYTVELSKIVL